MGAVEGMVAIVFGRVFLGFHNFGAVARTPVTNAQPQFWKFFSHSMPPIALQAGPMPFEHMGYRRHISPLTLRDPGGKLQSPNCFPGVAKGKPQNPKNAARALDRWSPRSALHHAEARMCISSPIHIYFIANIGRKKSEIKRGKSTAEFIPHQRALLVASRCLSDLYISQCMLLQ